MADPMTKGAGLAAASALTITHAAKAHCRQPDSIAANGARGSSAIDDRDMWTAPSGGRKERALPAGPWEVLGA